MDGIGPDISSLSKVYMCYKLASPMRKSKEKKNTYENEGEKKMGISSGGFIFRPFRMRAGTNKPSAH